MKRLVTLGLCTNLTSIAMNAPAALAQDATAYVIHGIPGQDLALVPELPVDVEVNGACVLQGLEFGETAVPLCLSAGSYSVRVSLANEDSPCSNDAILSGNYAIDAGMSYSIVANLDASGAPTISAFANDTSAANGRRSRVQVRHLAVAPSVDVEIRRGRRGPVVAQLADLTNGEEATAELRPGTRRVLVYPSGSSDAVFGPVSLELRPGTLTQVFAVGSVASGSFTLLVLDTDLDAVLDPTNFDFSPDVAASVDLERYGGKWFEIASIPSIASSFGFCTNTTAEYAALDCGRIRLRNECRLFRPNGPLNAIDGVARAIDESNARLAIRFEGYRVEQGYNILDLDSNYQWALVGGGPNGLFILSRSPKIDDAVYDDIISRVPEFGHDPGRLVLTFQSGNQE